MLNLQPPQKWLTVSEVSFALKSLLERNFAGIKVKGEISGLKIADSGHCYFSLKDQTALLNAICWRQVASKLQIKLEDGMEVICEGTISSYPGRSFYQINITGVEIAGVGALLKLFEQRKAQLAAEGLFAVERKKPIPMLPSTIAVVTSPTGAVIQDIIHRVSERFPVHIMIFGVLVQGPESANQVAEAINTLQNLPEQYPKPDVIIVARGGGSIEDLWSFNEEIVARAVADCTIPIISAIGHETDVTLIDFVADKRAPTPTAAAEMAVPVLKDLLATITHYHNRQLSSLRHIYQTYSHQLKNFGLRISMVENIVGKHQQKFELYSHQLKTGMESILAQNANTLLRLASRLSSSLLECILMKQQQQLADLHNRLNQFIKQRLLSEENSLELANCLLQSFSPKAVLMRGFVALKSGQNYISSIDQLEVGSKIQLVMHDGVADASISKKQQG